MSRLLYVVILCQAAQMHLRVNKGPGGPGITPTRNSSRPDFADEGFQYLKLQDFDIDGKARKFLLAQNDPHYSQFKIEELKGELRVLGVLEFPKQDNDAAEYIATLKQLLVVAEAAEMFAPDEHARKQFNRVVALQSLVWLLVDPTHLKRDRADLGNILDAGDATFIANQNDAYRKEFLALFINQALRIAYVDNGRFLAGLMHAIWMTRGDNLQKMWNRNLYKRSFKRLAIKSWRQWFQEELLSKNNNDLDTKEIVKSTVEEVTEVMRTAPKKTWAAPAMADALLDYFKAFGFRV